MKRKKGRVAKKITKTKPKHFMANITGNVKVTQALLDANAHIDVQVDDTIKPAQVTAPVTQAMLDADPALVAAGVAVGDVLSGTAPKNITGSFTGTLDTNGNFTITLTVDLTGTVSGVADQNGLITSVSAPLKV